MALKLEAVGTQLLCTVGQEWVHSKVSGEGEEEGDPVTNTVTTTRDSE